MSRLFLFLRSLLNLFNIKVVRIEALSFGFNRKGGFNIFFYRIYIKNKILDFDLNLGVENEFKQALNLLDNGNIVLCNVETKFLRQCWYYFLESSPITIATCFVLKGEYHNFHTSIKQNYNSNYPLNASDRVFISDKKHYLSSYSPIACPLPWDTDNITKISSSKETGYLKENSKMGLINCKEGLLFGPLSKPKIKAEYNRINKLLKSLKNNGYKRNSSDDGDIGGILLIDDSVESDIKFCVRLDTKGNHRASALVSLGYKSLPIRISHENIVRLSELSSWNYVLNNIFKKSEALKVFLNILNPID
jgi:hypothetical protein